MVGAFLAPQSNFFLHRAIQKAEEDRFLDNPVRTARPTRHDKYVPGVPAQTLVTDERLALAFYNLEDHAVSGSIRYRLEPCGQELHEGRHGGSNMITRGRVDITQFV